MRFSDDLIAQAQPDWQRATHHVFIREMVDGTLEKSRFAAYLVQDYLFIKVFLELLGYGIAYSQTMTQKHHLATFLSTITREENDYFIRSFKALGVDESQYLSPKLAPFPAIKSFRQAIKKAICPDGEMGYANCLIIIACAELVYCEWGLRYRDKTPTDFYFSEWLSLHNNTAFQHFVAWLKTELDLLARFPEAKHRQFSQLFTHICQLEAQFFDECMQKQVFYTHPTEEK